ncbi:hypothetical protein BHM03_00060433 [Ensete ventricosum]|nr:hypothetical protein BHM03_00060433 [Ensete ventricosum]
MQASLRFDVCCVSYIYITVIDVLPSHLLRATTDDPAEGSSAFIGRANDERHQNDGGVEREGDRKRSGERGVRVLWHVRGLHSHVHTPDQGVLPRKMDLRAVLRGGEVADEADTGGDHRRSRGLPHVSLQEVQQDRSAQPQAFLGSFHEGHSEEELRA